MYVSIGYGYRFQTRVLAAMNYDHLYTIPKGLGPTNVKSCLMVTG